MRTSPFMKNKTSSVKSQRRWGYLDLSWHKKLQKLSIVIVVYRFYREFLSNL